MVAIPPFDATKVAPTRAIDLSERNAEYRQQALDGALDDIRSAPRGTRNIAMTGAAVIFGKQVGGGYLDYNDAARKLAAAGAEAGMLPYEYGPTIKGQLAWGMARPWEDQDEDAPAHRSPKASHRAAPTNAVALDAESEQKAASAVALYEGSGPVAGTRAVDYLARRGITAIPDKARYSTTFNGLVLPITQPDGTITAVQKIPIGTDLARGKKTTNGPMGDGAFVIPGAGPATVALDGPEDAMVAHQATGWRCLAMLGKGRMVRAIAHMAEGEHLIIVRDNDPEDGPEYVKAIAAADQAGVIVTILEPPGGAKDCNDVLLDQGLAVVREWLERPLQRAAELARAEAADDDIEPPTDGGPPILPEPQGLLREIRDHIVATTIYQHPTLALGAALAILASVAGRRYSYDHNIRPNLYIIGLAPSSSGKGSAIDAVERILSESGFDSLLAGKEPASGAAVISRIMAHPVSTYVMDEIGMLLSALSDPRASQHLKEITKVLTELYTKSDGRFADKDRAMRDTTPTRVVLQPSLTIYGIAAAVHVWNSITPDNVRDGSLARFLVLETPTSFPMPVRHRKSRDTPDAIKAALQAIQHFGRDPEAGNLAGIGANTAPSLREVHATEEVDQRFWDLMVEEVELKRRHEVSGLSAIYGRMVEQSKKLALIHAIGRDPTGMIEMVDAAWAITTVRLLIDRMVGNMTKHVARNEREKLSQEVLAIIRSSGKTGMAKNRITDKTRHLKVSERNEILSDLLESGKVATEAVCTSSRGPKSQVFVAVNKKTR
ncbi:MAG: hypothetical protein GC191_08965 [Azospirillum sp.]|nr:hypothetical protein [Azospirillum sp.]